MHRIQHFGLLGLVGWMVLGLVRSAPAQVHYLFAPFDVPGASYAGTSAFGINDKGTIVGNYGVLSGGVDGFVFENGVFTDVPVPDSPFVFLYGINNRGVAVGSYYSQDFSASYGLLYAPDGTLTTLPDPVSGASHVAAFGINDAGTIVGSVDGHGFILRKGVYTLFDFPGAAHGTSLHGINNAGQIIGIWSDAAYHAHSFILVQGDLFPIAVPGAVSTGCLGISNNGLIVGWYEKGGKHHGFVLEAGLFSRLDYPGSFDCDPFGINDAGVVVGTYQFESLGFVAVPTD